MPPGACFTFPAQSSGLEVSKRIISRNFSMTGHLPSVLLHRKLNSVHAMGCLVVGFAPDCMMLCTYAREGGGGGQGRAVVSVVQRTQLLQSCPKYSIAAVLLPSCCKDKHSAGRTVPTALSCSKYKKNNGRMVQPSVTGDPQGDYHLGQWAWESEFAQVNEAMGSGLLFSMSSLTWLSCSMKLWCTWLAGLHQMRSSQGHHMCVALRLLH